MTVFVVDIINDFLDDYWLLYFWFLLYHLFFQVDPANIEGLKSRLEQKDKEICALKQAAKVMWMCFKKKQKLSSNTSQFLILLPNAKRTVLNVKLPAELKNIFGTSSLIVKALLFFRQPDGWCIISKLVKATQISVKLAKELEEKNFQLSNTFKNVQICNANIMYQRIQHS